MSERNPKRSPKLNPTRDPLDRCPVCNRRISRMHDGRLRGHVINPNTADEFIRCDGSGTTRPVNETTTETTT